MDAMPISTNHELLREWKKTLNEKPLKSPFPQMELFEGTATDTLFDSLLKHSLKNPNSVAIIDAANNGHFITHRELRERALSIGSFLVQHGFQPGERAAISLTSTIDYVTACVGIWAAGGCLEPMDAHMKDYEKELQFNDCLPTIIITHEYPLGSVMNAARGCRLKAIICLRDPLSTDSLPANVADLAEVLKTPPLEHHVTVNMDDIVLVSYTSGTTGTPKGALISHRAYNSSLYRWIMHWESEMYPMIGRNEIDWYSEAQIVALPTTHIFGFGCLYLYLNTGSPIVLLEKFDPELYIQMIAKYKPRALMLNPAMLNALVKTSSTSNADISSIELIFSASTSAGDSVCEEILNNNRNMKFIVQAYGMTEICGMSHLPIVLNRESYKTIGVVAPYCEQIIMDLETSQPCKMGQSGELWIRSKLQMSGYLNKPEETAAILSEDGFLKTGDMAYMDKDGLVYITGRIKHFIKVNSLQVSPVLIEDLLMSHPKISDAAVIGIPDKERGENVCAVIVSTDASLSEKEVFDFVAERMTAASNLTGGVYFVNEIPRSTAGKFQRRVLEKIVAGVN